MQRDIALHWRSWIAQFDGNAGLDARNGGADWSGVLKDLKELEESRQVVVDRLVECGVNRVALENLNKGEDNPKIVLAFV